MAADIALKTLNDALKKGVFDGAYYICGEDDFQKDDAVRRLSSAAIEPAMRDFNTDTYRAADMDPKSLDSVLSAIPMMSDRRVVIIRDVSALKKDARKALGRYLENPAPDVLVLLLETSGAKKDKELAATTTLLEFATLSPGRIPRWIAHQASELGMKISEDAIELLQSAVGADLHQLIAELDKLASYAHGREIEEGDVAAVVGIRKGETMSDLLDQVALRDATPALQLVGPVLDQPRNSAVTLVMALTVQTIALAWGKAKIEEGLSPARLHKEYFEFLKQSGSAFTGRPWGAAATAWAGAVDRWSAASLDRALAALLDADVALKETKISSDEQIASTLILSMCVEDEKSVAA